MSHYRADLAVFIGRFQPLHLGHEYAVRKALEFSKQVLIIIGDTGGPRTIKNPWTLDERESMIQEAFFDEIGDGRVLIDSALDFPYTDHEWIAQVQDIVNNTAEELHAEKIAIVGHEKDSSSFYLRVFPQWKFVDTGFEELSNGIIRRIDATEIRKMIFEGRMQYATGVLSEHVIEYLAMHRRNQDIYEALIQEYEFINEYRKSWEFAPFPPVFVTTDAVVVQSGHVLLVKRGQNPGLGLYALPGGFIGQSEGIDECAIRELIEETSIKLQPEVLFRCIKHVEVFDRRGGVSQEDRGRIITHAHLIKLDDTKPLPKVKGGDDAAEAHWVPISEIDYLNMFSDHGHILRTMLRKL